MSGLRGKRGFFSGRWGLYAEHLGNYMRRWIARCPWFTLRLHNILQSDEGRDHHDHPFDFTSLILRGGYVEHRPGCDCFTPDEQLGRLTECRFYGPGSIVRRTTPRCPQTTHSMR